MNIPNYSYYDVFLSLWTPTLPCSPPEFYYLRYFSHTASASSSLIMHKGFSLTAPPFLHFLGSEYEQSKLKPFPASASEAEIILWRQGSEMVLNQSRGEMQTSSLAGLSTGPSTPATSTPFCLQLTAPSHYFSIFILG